MYLSLRSASGLSKMVITCSTKQAGWAEYERLGHMMNSTESHFSSDEDFSNAFLDK
jgi:hypothetical protein